MGTRMPTQRLKIRARRAAPLSPPNRIHRRTPPAPRQQPSRAQTPAPRIRDRKTRTPQAVTTAHPQAAQALAKLPAIIRIRIQTTQITLAQRAQAAMPQTQDQQGRNRAHHRSRKRNRANKPQRDASLRKSRDCTGFATSCRKKWACIILQARHYSESIGISLGHAPCAPASRRSSSFRPYRSS